MTSINTEHRNRYVLITGATSGIGFELARLFAGDSYNLIIVARDEQRLQEVADELKRNFSIEVNPLPADLFRPDAADMIFEKVKELGVTIDILVNDAGQGEWGHFLDTPLERDREVVQLNILSLLSLTKLFAGEMVARGEGRILQLGSEAGTAPMPLLAVYAATKAFVISFSMALADELKDTGVKVTVLLPGATDTDFFHKANQQETVTYKEKKLADPAKVARDGYEALMKGERKVISGSKTWFHVWMNDLLGDQMAAANARKMMESSDSEEAAGMPEHTASRMERERINDLTGKESGDRGQEQSIKTIVSGEDLKGKKVDGDPENPADQPSH